MLETVYYSPLLKKYYKTREEGDKAEKDYNDKLALELKAKEEKEARAKEVEDAYAKFIKLKNEYFKDYGELNIHYKDKDNDVESLFNYFFKKF